MTAQSKLDKLEQQRAALQRQINLEKTKVREKQRKLDTRRKVVAGAVVLKHAEIHPAFAEQLRAILDEHVYQDRDRLMLGLQPHGTKAAPEQDSASTDWSTAASGS